MHFPALFIPPFWYSSTSLPRSMYSWWKKRGQYSLPFQSLPSNSFLREKKKKKKKKTRPHLPPEDSLSKTPPHPICTPRFTFIKLLQNIGLLYQATSNHMSIWLHDHTVTIYHKAILDIWTWPWIASSNSCINKITNYPSSYRECFPYVIFHDITTHK